MSRYALEWAKQQRPASAESHVLLLVLGDYAEGLNSECAANEAQLADDTGIDRTLLASAIKSLVADDLVVAEFIPRPAGGSAAAKALRRHAVDTWGEHWRISLCIPVNWRARRRCSRGSGPAVYAQRTAVYRLYDKADALLYVGVSDRPKRRFEQHRRKQPWWTEVVTREIEWFDDRYAAEVEEFWAITREDPLYNVRHGRNLGRP